MEGVAGGGGGDGLASGAAHASNLDILRDNPGASASRAAPGPMACAPGTGCVRPFALRGAAWTTVCAVRKTRWTQWTWTSMRMRGARRPALVWAKTTSMAVDLVAATVI